MPLDVMTDLADEGPTRVAENPQMLGKPHHALLSPRLRATDVPRRRRRARHANPNRNTRTPRSNRTCRSASSRVETEAATQPQSRGTILWTRSRHPHGCQGDIPTRPCSVRSTQRQDRKPCSERSGQTRLWARRRGATRVRPVRLGSEPAGPADRRRRRHPWSPGWHVPEGLAHRREERPPAGRPKTPPFVGRRQP